jgi:hypothetical protein
VHVVIVIELVVDLNDFIIWCVTAMSQANKRELARLKASITANPAEKLRYIHCNKCHNDRHTKKFLVWKGTSRKVHRCTAKNACKDYNTCPAMTEQKKKEYHKVQWTQLRIDQLEAEVKVKKKLSTYNTHNYYNILISNK